MVRPMFFLRRVATGSESKQEPIVTSAQRNGIPLPPALHKILHILHQCACRILKQAGGRGERREEKRKGSLPPALLYNALGKTNFHLSTIMQVITTRHFDYYLKLSSCAVKMYMLQH
ncbi:UNVERIFIED_CONTAM: hypothetical protein K2H54_032435 [Gekko kuhli]